MGEKIQLKEELAITDTLFFSVTNTGFEQMECLQGADAILSALSKSSILLITKEKNDSKKQRFTVHMPFGKFNCKVNDLGRSSTNYGLLILAYKENDFVSQNKAMKNGVCFRMDKGVCVSVRNTNHNVFCEYFNGRDIGNTSRTSNSSSKALYEMTEAFYILENIRQADNGVLYKNEFEDAYKPCDELDKVLTLSENYSKIISDLEEAKVNSSGKLSYSDIRPLNYDRTDRVAYRFIVDKLNKSTFPVGTQIEITDILGKPYSAEIINSEMDEDEERHVDLLLNKQININSFEKQGFISLSFSTVNKDVQLKANENLRLGKASAKYMDNILGKYAPAGFNDIDLSHLSAHYADEEFYKKPPFPPNPSQQEAILKGIKSKDVFLVMGPPGTGKTTVILEWIKYFVLEKHLRVLVSSQNNKAVDNVLERIIEEPDIDVLRIGSEAKLQENVKQCMFENKISELRKNISSASRENLKKLNNLQEDNEALCEKLKNISELNTQIDISKKVLDGKIKSNLLKSFEWCNDIASQAEKTKKSFASENQKTQKLSEELKKLNNISNGIVKKLLFLVIFIFQKLFNRSVNKLQEYKRDLASLEIDYKNQIKLYNEIYKNIKQNEFELYRVAIERHDVAIDDAIICCCKFNEFRLEKLTNEHIKNMIQNSKFNELAEELCEDSVRAKKTSEIIKSWAEEMDIDQNYALNEIIMQSVNLVGATCIGINSQKRFSDLQFDVTIIDEAGQIQIHNALVPMSVSNKLIMLGDHKQIPPTADEEVLKALEDRSIETELYEKSLFEVMYENLPESNKQMLDTQFRMPGEVADIISEWFYDGQYLSSDIKRGIKSVLPSISDKPFIVVDTGDSDERYETEVSKGDMKERFNDVECDVIVKICKKLAEQNYDLSEVGVISALKAQVNRIKEKLIEAGFEKGAVNEMVATLDSFQGQERNVILYSFVRSSKRSKHQNRIGFLTEIRRLNVAMSRCKKTIVMIGDMKFLSECESEKDYRGRHIEETKTELNFSKFIQKMVDDVKTKDRGRIITTAEFNKRITE